MANIELNSLNSSAPVTALHVHEDLLFYASGNRLNVRNLLSPSTATSIIISKHWNIHGVCVSKHGDSTDVLIRGNRFLAVYKLITGAQGFELKRISEDFNFCDWIIDFKADADRVDVVLSSNVLVRFSWITREVLSRTKCPVSCIVYSAHLLPSPSATKSIVASGTVFTQVILWAVDHELQSAKLLQTLDGHDGVIFAIDYDPLTRRLVTASDDRSIKLWSRSVGSGDDDDVAFEYVTTLYGHESRIWSIVQFEDYLISIGENGNLCAWSADVTLVQKIIGTSSIWTLAVDKMRCQLHLGYNDGRIDVHDLKQLTRIQDGCLMIKSENSFTKALNFIESDSKIYLLAMSNLGLLEAFEANQSDSKFRLSLPDYADYSLMTTIGNTVLVANKEGSIAYIDARTASFEIRNKLSAHQGKVFSLFALDSNSFLSCGLNGQMKKWHVRQDGIDLNGEYTLPPSRHRWPTCGLFSDHHLVVGDRCGGVTCFSLSSSEKNSNYVNHFKLHGENGVTDMILVDQCRVYSCGRDGRVLEYTLEKTGLCVLRVVRTFTDLTWLSRIMVSEHQFTVLGFASNMFVVYDLNSGVTRWQLECGGGHRCWDHKVSPISQTENFVFSKQDSVTWHSRNSSNIQISSSASAEDIHCIKFLEKSGSIFATGSEDNLIRIHKLENSKVTCTDVLYGHIASVRTLSSFPVSSNEWILVTAGGRSQLMVWKISDHENKLRIQQLVSHFVWTLDGRHRKPWKEKNLVLAEEPQIRFNSIQIFNQHQTDKSKFTIIGGCSDGNIRIFGLELAVDGRCCFGLLRQVEVSSYSVITGCFVSNLVISGFNNGSLGVHCLLNLVNWSPTNQLSLLPLSTSNSNQWRPLTPEVVDLKKVANRDSHQNGITAIDAIEYGENLVIVTGGDDCSLTVTVIQRTPKSFLVKESASRESAHTSGITGLRLIQKEAKLLIVTASIDQRIKVWSLEIIEKSPLVLIEVKCNLSSISDISSIDCDRNSKNVIVCGQGLEVFTL
ncbi:WD repeat-containing protein 6 [Halotydeus destructor]|nr:WD repeat-containing protein 6 [Halotydeus destructor]